MKKLLQQLLITTAVPSRGLNGTLQPQCDRGLLEDAFSYLKLASCPFSNTKLQIAQPVPKQPRHLYHKALHPPKPSSRKQVLTLNKPCWLWPAGDNTGHRGVTYLCHSVQQPSQHISPFQFGSLHRFKLHNHRIDLGDDTADWMLHAINPPHESEGNKQ